MRTDIVRTRILPKKSNNRRGVVISDYAIGAALQQTLGNKQKAARVLNMGASTVYVRIRKSDYLKAVIEQLYLDLIDSSEEVLREGITKGKNLRASMWALERLDRERYGRTAPPEESGLPKGDLIINILCQQPDGTVTKQVHNPEGIETFTLDPSEYEIQDGKVKLLEDKSEGE